LKLKVNREKSSGLDRTVAGLLGFGFYFALAARSGCGSHQKAWKRLKMRLKQLTRRSWGVSMEHRIGEAEPLHRGMVRLLRDR
jgi:RNA-directed DNA polymerase